MEAGKIRPTRIDEEMKGAYLDYAMSVITARALPDVRDGLKPVQRRILYAMHELALHPTTPYKKSARIVGEVLGKYHPHGDAPVYETMVRMAQDFSLRYMLVDGQGNFGSVDGDPPAAMRYTEARLSPIAEELLADIEKDTVDYAPNFDDTLKEPSVLPAKLPNLLVNGSSGIAVGMATNIPPHNLGEIVDALTFVLSRLQGCLAAGVPAGLLWARAFNQPIEPEAAQAALAGLNRDWAARVKDSASKLTKKPTADDQGQALLALIDEAADVLPEELLSIVKGPDFPTAGIIQGAEGIRSAYATGHGRITLRARVHTEDMRAGRQQLVVNELPFQLNKTSLLERIAEMVRDRRIEGISELRDESDRQGMRIVVELRRDVSPRQILNQLYRYTQMQTTFSINMLALVDGQPRVLTLKMLLLHYVNYRQQVLTRRTQHELEKARARAHILQGLKIALDHLDEVIALIRRSRDAETARTGLMRQFKLSEIQAQAILDMQLRRLAALERRKIIEELEAVLKLIAHLEDLLAHPAKILALVGEEMGDLKAKFGDGRRTTIVEEEAGEFREEDLIPKQDVVVMFTAKGYVRRLPADSFLSRRGRGQTAVVTQEDDAPRYLARANTHETLLMFSDKGRAFAARVHDLPDAGRTPRGLPLSNFLSLENSDRIVAAFPQPAEQASQFCLLATKSGEVKRVALADLSNVRATGTPVIDMPEGDELVTAALTDGKQEMILVTEKGQALRFAETELRASGRGSGGVRGIRLDRGDRVAAAPLAEPGGELILVTSSGLAKRTSLGEYTTQGRGGGGIKAATVNERTGPVAVAAVASASSEVILASAGGLMLRTAVETLPRMGRTSQGKRISELAEKDVAIGLWAMNGGTAATPTPAPESGPAPKGQGKSAAKEKASAAPEKARGDGRAKSASSAKAAAVAPAKEPASKGPAKAGKASSPAAMAKKASTSKGGAKGAEMGKAAAAPARRTARVEQAPLLGLAPSSDPKAAPKRKAPGGGKTASGAGSPTAPDKTRAKQAPASAGATARPRAGRSAPNTVASPAKSGASSSTPPASRGKVGSPASRPPRARVEK